MKYYIGLGSNLGKRKENILKAINFFKNYDKITFIKSSKIIETEPYGNIGQPNFLNCVIVIGSEIKPIDMLNICLKIEQKMGRKRTIKWGPRIIDIDILICDNQIVNENNLIIPHPELYKRKFVLTSLNELCPEFIHPIINKKIKTMYGSVD
ncbi:MAG: 2-amino-4-hydroxy-6-hydroxymethyldihydropteridine diphosphokinase [Candidatus Cloacimonetes bacterium]|nr:2-amino-4-hydroxy-6-hydroxymethyldihydropteridine diphosphokinase [Candidatus Cloacimonadota bacterium]